MSDYVRPIGKGLSELRTDHGPGYRLCFLRRGTLMVLLLCGGNKQTQHQAIAKAHAPASGREARDK